MIGQHAADDAPFGVGHPNHAQFTAAVFAAYATLMSIRLRCDSAAEPEGPAEIQPDMRAAAAANTTRQAR